MTAQASDGTDTSSQTFVIDVTDVPPSTPVDSDAAANQVSMNAPVGTHVGVTASSTDVNGPAVTYSLIGDTSGGGFTVDPATGVVTVADSSKVIFISNPTTYDVTVRCERRHGSRASRRSPLTLFRTRRRSRTTIRCRRQRPAASTTRLPVPIPPATSSLPPALPARCRTPTRRIPRNALTVVAVHTGPEGASTGTGTVGQDLVGSHGTLHLNSDGSYTYAVNQTDAQVQALHTSAETITDVFNYTIQDTGGLQDTASITFTIHGADDLPQAVADTGTMTEDSAPTSFNVIANDTQDPDHTAANTITVGPGGVTVTGPAGETFANTDATASIVSNQVQVTLNNAHFQQLAVGESATVTVPYTLTGDVGETSSANLVVTVNGVNDVPVAVDDSGTMTEDQSGHAFTVLANDTLDADHGAPNNVTVGTVTNLVAPSGENIDTSDVSVSVNGSNQVVVNLGSDFQHMQDGQTTTFDVAYTLHGDQPGDTSTADAARHRHRRERCAGGGQFHLQRRQQRDRQHRSRRQRSRPTAPPIRPARKRPSPPACSAWRQRRRRSRTARSWSPATSRPRMAAPSPCSRTAISSTSRRSATPARIPSTIRSRTRTPALRASVSARER